MKKIILPGYENQTEFVSVPKGMLADAHNAIVGGTFPNAPFSVITSIATALRIAATLSSDDKPLGDGKTPAAPPEPPQSPEAPTANNQPGGENGESGAGGSADQ